MRIDNIHTGIYIQVYIYRVPRKKVVHLLKSPNKTVVLGVLLFFGVFPGRTTFFRGTLYIYILIAPIPGFWGLFVKALRPYFSETQARRWGGGEDSL